MIRLMNDELGEEIMIQFVGLRAKTYSYIIHNGGEDKKGKCAKKCVIEKTYICENHKNCLEATECENKIN